MHYTEKNLPFGGVGESGMGAYHGKERKVITVRGIHTRCTIFGSLLIIINSLRIRNVEITKTYSMTLCIFLLYEANGTFKRWPKMVKTKPDSKFLELRFNVL